jgi:hypothetical protein
MGRKEYIGGFPFRQLAYFAAARDSKAIVAKAG